MGLLFGVLLLTLLIGSINYEKSLGFMLTFLLAAIGNEFFHNLHNSRFNMECRG